METHVQISHLFYHFVLGRSQSKKFDHYIHPTNALHLIFILKLLCFLRQNH
jgi:hypothetical protein